MLSQKYTTIYLFLCTIILLSACGAPAQTDSDIATAVAQTVQAQNSLTKAAIPLTPSPVPPPEISPSPQPSPTNDPTGPAGNPGCVASAGLIAENPPDNTLLNPGEYYWKTWSFLNTGTCIWNPSYNLVFWDGDLMGGLVSYPFTEIVNPGETMDISIYLLAPATEGTFTGYWRFKTSWDEYFGVGAQSSSFYVQISTSDKPRYGIANVTYTLIREPVTGCPQNVRYYVYATVTTNGPMTFSYYWDQSDGNKSSDRDYRVKNAESVTFKRDWLISKYDSPNPRWIKFIITGPEYRDYGKVDILHNCFVDENNN